VNAAGITHYTALFTTQPDLLEEVVHTNLMGTMLSCKIVGRLMMGKKSTDGGSSLQYLELTIETMLTNTGCIINISSLLGLKGGKGSVGYAASKAGVIGKPLAIFELFPILTHTFQV
jgi:NAD(P)-dependent dehydrogenase (short-subunit alcohol dehydrogenase family)